MLSLAKLVSQIDRDKITTWSSTPTTCTPFKGADGADLLGPNMPAIRRAIAAAQNVGGAS